MPLSGSEQPSALDGKEGRRISRIAQIRKAIKEAKADHTVTITHENYRSEPSSPRTTRRSSRGRGKTCLVGPWSTGGADPGREHDLGAEEGGRRSRPAASNDALENARDRRLLHPHGARRTASRAEALATTIADAIGGAKGKKVSVAALQDIYGTDLVKSFSDAWQKLGGKIAARVDLRAQPAGLQEAGQDLVAPKPDAFVFFDFQDTYLKVATELLKTHKWKPSRSFATDSLAISTLGQCGGATVEGLRGVAPGSPRFGAGARRSSASGRRDRRPKYRQPFDAAGIRRDRALLPLRGRRRVDEGLPDEDPGPRRSASPPGTKYGWRQLSEAIRALEAGKDIDYEGASGPIDMRAARRDQAGRPDRRRLRRLPVQERASRAYGSVSVPPTGKGVESFPVHYVTPRIPGVTPAAAGDRRDPAPRVPRALPGAKGAKGKKKTPKKKHNSGEVTQALAESVAPGRRPASPGGMPERLAQGGGEAEDRRVLLVVEHPVPLLAAQGRFRPPPRRTSGPASFARAPPETVSCSG